MYLALAGRIFTTAYFNKKRFKEKAIEWNYAIFFNTVVGGKNGLAVQKLRFCTSHARGKGTIPDQRTKIPHAAQHGKTKNQNIYTHNKKTKKGQNMFQINSDWEEKKKDDA